MNRLKHWQTCVFVSATLVFAVFLTSCKPITRTPEPQLETLIHEGLSASESLIVVSTNELLKHLICEKDEVLPYAKKSEERFNKVKESLFSNLKSKIGVADLWERLELLDSLIACQAEGISTVVIEQFARENDPLLREQYITLIARAGSLPLKREIATRVMRSNILRNKPLAFNLLLAPTYNGQLESGDEVRILPLVERLSREIETADAIIAAKNLKYLMRANTLDLKQPHQKKIVRKLIKDLNKSNDDAVLRIAAILALAAPPEAESIFDTSIPPRGGAARMIYDVEGGERYLKLGKIAYGFSSPSEINSLMKENDLLQTVECIEALLTNGSDEALQEVLKIIPGSTAEIRRYISSTLFDPGNHVWKNDEVAQLLIRSSEPDRALIYRYLLSLKKNEGKKDAAQKQDDQQEDQVEPKLVFSEVYKEGIKLAPPDRQTKILSDLLNTVFAASDLEDLRPLLPMFKEVAESGNYATQSRVVAQKLTGLFTVIDTKHKFSLEVYNSTPFDSRFHRLLVSANANLLTDDLIVKLRFSDNLFERLVIVLFYDDP